MSRKSNHAASAELGAVPPLPQNQSAQPSEIIDFKELHSRIPWICSKTLRAHVNSGLIPCIRLRGRILFLWSSVMAALRRMEKGQAR